VLDPARLRKDLPELRLRRAADPGLVVEDERARAGRALVEREYESIRQRRSSFKPGLRRARAAA
jgi:hypothetical protein